MSNVIVRPPKVNAEARALLWRIDAQLRKKAEEKKIARQYKEKQRLIEKNKVKNVQRSLLWWEKKKIEETSPAFFRAIILLGLSGRASLSQKNRSSSDVFHIESVTEPGTLLKLTFRRDCADLLIEKGMANVVAFCCVYKHSSVLEATSECVEIALDHVREKISQNKKLFNNSNPTPSGLRGLGLPCPKIETIKFSRW
jgi:hypothetical protein